MEVELKPTIMSILDIERSTEFYVCLVKIR
jgi:hypothetical protein